MVKTAIHAAVWSTDPAPDAIARTLAEVAEIGFDAMALPLRNLPGLETAALARRFEEAGVIPFGTTGVAADADISSLDGETRARGEAHLGRVLAHARDIGVQQINGVYYGALAWAGSPVCHERRQRSAEVMHRMAEAAAGMGIRLCAEVVNRYETAMLNSVDQGLEYLALVDHPNLRLHLDTYHIAIEERRPLEAIARAVPSLGYFELDQSHRGYLDEGSLDLRAMAAPVAQGGYQGFVGVEAFTRRNFIADDHANGLSIWRDQFEDGSRLARGAMALIREVFGPN